GSFRFGRELEIGFDADAFRFADARSTARTAARFSVRSVPGTAAVPEAFVFDVLSRIATHAADSTLIDGISLAVQITVTKEGLMVDNMNPNNQFHPYQPETSTPAIENAATGLRSTRHILAGAT